MLCKELKALKAATGLTNGELADMLQISRPHMANIIAGRRSVPEELGYRIRVLLELGSAVKRGWVVDIRS